MDLQAARGDTQNPPMVLPMSYLRPCALRVRMFTAPCHRCGYRRYVDHSAMMPFARCLSQEAEQTREEREADLGAWNAFPHNHESTQ